MKRIATTLAAAAVAALGAGGIASAHTSPAHHSVKVNPAARLLMHHHHAML